MEKRQREMDDNEKLERLSKLRKIEDMDISIEEKLKLLLDRNKKQAETIKKLMSDKQKFEDIIRDYQDKANAAECKVIAIDCDFREYKELVQAEYQKYDERELNFQNRIKQLTEEKKQNLMKEAIRESDSFKITDCHHFSGQREKQRWCKDCDLLRDTENQQYCYNPSHIRGSKQSIVLKKLRCQTCSN